MRSLIAIGAVALGIGTSACGPTVDVAAGLSIESLTSGWVPVEAPAGQSKLVPAVSFRLRNASDAALPVVQVNAIFHRGAAAEEWGNAFHTAAGSEGLPAGASTDYVLLASQKGYTGTDAPADLIENSQFVDARVDLYGRYGSRPWTRLGEFPVTRVLLNP
jgi:hypothetical protein